MPVLILTEAELRECVGFDAESLRAVEEAFTWLCEGRVSMPPVMHVEVAEHRGDVDIKSAGVRGIESLAVKIASGFFDNPKLGLPSGGAMVVVLSARTGFCEAVLLDNAYLTDLRTGLAGAVAARHLAPATVRGVGVLGAGAQARYQLRALRLVRDFERVLVSTRDAGRGAAFAAQMSESLGVPVELSSPAHVVQESELVITCTPAREPLLDAAWLHPGLHITAVGADLPGKQELDPRILVRAARVVCDRRAQCFDLGELQHLRAAGLGLDENAVTELGEITSGRTPGRRSEQEITVCDLTGTGVQDTAIAHLALTQARSRGIGTPIDS